MINKARANTNLKAFAKLTEVVDGQLRITEDPPVIERIRDPADRWTTRAILMDCYLATLPDDRRLLLHNFRFVDAARKVVGVGSVGTRCSIALLVGRVNGEPLFLQVKEAERVDPRAVPRVEPARQPRRAGRRRSATTCRR